MAESLFQQAGVEMASEERDEEPGAVPEPSEESPPSPRQPTDPAPEEEPFVDPADLPAELQAHWKRMQAAFTKGRQKDRETARALQEKAAMVDKFNSDPQFALNTVMQVAPLLGIRLEPMHPGTPTPPSGTPGQGGLTEDALTKLLQDKLGPDVAFLAPALAPALLNVVKDVSQAAMAPLQQQLEGQTRQQQLAAIQAREAEENALMQALDARMPGWEEEYGEQMQALDAFLGSDQLTHPQFGNKYELYLRLLAPGLSRVEAVKEVQRASRNGIRTGRTGGQTQSSLVQQIGDVYRKGGPQRGWADMWTFVQRHSDQIAEELRDR